MQQNKSSKEYVEQLTTNQYYSLLDKHIELQALCKQYKMNYIKAKESLMSFKQQCSENLEEIALIHNKRLDHIVGVLRKHKCSLLAIEDVEALKVEKELEIEI